MPFLSTGELSPFIMHRCQMGGSETFDRQDRPGRTAFRSIAEYKLLQLKSLERNSAILLKCIDSRNGALRIAPDFQVKILVRITLGGVAVLHKSRIHSACTLCLVLFPIAASMAAFYHSRSQSKLVVAAIFSVKSGVLGSKVTSEFSTLSNQVSSHPTLASENIEHHPPHPCQPSPSPPLQPSPSPCSQISPHAAKSLPHPTWPSPSPHRSQVPPPPTAAKSLLPQQPSPSPCCPVSPL